jgi:hypothetical protein
MGYATVNKLQRVTPLLGKYHLNSNHFAMLHAVGLRQNDQRRTEVQSGKYTEYSRSGLRAWCFAGERRLAHDWSLSVKTAHRALVLLEKIGFIECRPNPNCRKAFFRRLNEKKIDELLQELPAFEAAYLKSLSHDSDDDDSESEFEAANECSAEATNECSDPEEIAYLERLREAHGDAFVYLFPDLQECGDALWSLIAALGYPAEFKGRTAELQKQIAPIEQNYGEDNVEEALRHALQPEDGSEFWLPLFRKQADPVKFLLKSMETIMGQGQAWKREYLKTPAGLAETAERARLEAVRASIRTSEALDMSTDAEADDAI